MGNKKSSFQEGTETTHESNEEYQDATDSANAPLNDLVERTSEDLNIDENAFESQMIESLQCHQSIQDVVVPGSSGTAERTVNSEQESTVSFFTETEELTTYQREEPQQVPFNPLKRRKKIFGGLVQEAKQRYPFYISDISDGINMKCIGAAMYIYFAAVSGAIAFGGLLSDKTEMNIGISETLIGTSISGILFSLFSGQPLIIVGTTGPLLLFDEILFQYYSSQFLTIRLWTSIWTTVIAVIVVAAEGSSFLVKLFTRFIQEVFATIISLLFIYESFSKLHMIFVQNPLRNDYNLNGTAMSPNSSSSEATPFYPQPNTALLSTMLMVGTFCIAFALRRFGNSKFLCRSFRRALGDFSVPIGIIVMVVIDYLIPDTYTQKLDVPDGFYPSMSRRWIIDPSPILWCEALITFIPGILLFILLFLETQICQLLLSKKKLRKGTGFHIDMLIICVLNLISAFIGGPWQCAATVRSISHVSSLIVWSKTHARGEVPHIIEVKEQRVTNFLVSVLVGVSVVMAPLLRQVPLPVLFGVFLYMGISSLSGLHISERFLMAFQPTKHHTAYPFVRKVKTYKMHLYTGIQIFCIGILWIIKMYVSPLFPFGLLAMVVVRKLLHIAFTNEEMTALDGEETGDEGDNENIQNQNVP